MFPGRRHAERYAKKLLEILRWVEEWKDACTVDGKVNWDISLTQETYKSMQYVCYGFVAMIYELAIRKDIELLPSVKSTKTYVNGTFHISEPHVHATTIRLKSHPTTQI